MSAQNTFDRQSASRVCAAGAGGCALCTTRERAAQPKPTAPH